MRVLTPLINSIALAVLILPTMASHCWGSGEPVSTKPPVGSDQRTCDVRPAPGWGANWPELSYSFDETRHCPYTVVSSGSPIPFRLEFRVSPYGNTQSYLWSAFGVFSNTGQTLQSSGYYYFYPVDPPGWQESQINSSYPGGLGNYPIQDSAAVVVNGGATVPNYPSMWILLPGRIEAAPPAISGADFVVSDYPQWWSAMVTEEPVSYRYQWFLNGSVLKGETGQHLSRTLTEGSHNLELQVLRTDNSMVFLSLAVTAVNCGGPNIC